MRTTPYLVSEEVYRISYQMRNEIAPEPRILASLKYKYRNTATD